MLATPHTRIHLHQVGNRSTTLPHCARQPVRFVSPLSHHHWGAHRELPVMSMGIMVVLLTSLFSTDTFTHHGPQQVKPGTQVSVQTKLKTLEGSLKSLEGKPCTNCSPQPLSASNNQQLSMLKLTNASSLADSSKFFKSMPPPKTLPQVKPAIHRPLSAGALDKSQQMSSFQTQQREACVDSRRCANGTGTVANQVGHRNSRQGSCAMCAANLLGGPNLTSRSLLKVVYNSSDSCPIHEDFAKWAFTTKQQRSLLHSQSLCGSTTFASDTPHSLPSSVASVSQDSALRELALNESYIIHEAEVHGATGGAVRRNVLSALPGSSGSAHAPVSKESAPSRDAGLSSQRTGPRAVISNVGRHSKNFKHTPSKKGRVRDVFDFDSPESPPDAENRLPLRRLRGTVVFPETRKPGTVQLLHEVYCSKLSRSSAVGAVV